jgi:hypothetical protein
MVYVGGHSDRLEAYTRLSVWERRVLGTWIAEHVDLSTIWMYTSLGLVELFENSTFGFAITHGQFKQAMLHSGYRVNFSEGDIWVFDGPGELEALD